MPSYYILPLLEKQKEKYGEQIARAQEDLRRFEQGLDVLVGAEVAAIVRQHIHLKCGKLPELPPEGQEAVAEVQRLIKAETTLTRHLHSFPCCFGDFIAPPHVLSCLVITWDDLQEREEDGRLPLRQVIWLLDAVLNAEMRLPTAEELAARGHRDWDEAHTVDEWHRVLRRKREHLITFLRTAVELEEDLVPGFI